MDELEDGETKMDADGDSGGAGAAEAVTAPEGAVASGADADRHERDASDQASNEDRAGEDRRCGDADEAHMEAEPCQEMDASAGVWGRRWLRRQQRRGQRRVKPRYADMLY